MTVMQAQGFICFAQKGEICKVAVQQGGHQNCFFAAGTGRSGTAESDDNEGTLRLHFSLCNGEKEVTFAPSEIIDMQIVEVESLVRLLNLMKRDESLIVLRPYRINL